MREHRAGERSTLAAVMVGTSVSHYRILDTIWLDKYVVRFADGVGSPGSGPQKVTRGSRRAGLAAANGRAGSPKGLPYDILKRTFN